MNHESIMLGVSGGIAVYKGVDLASRLKKNGFSVYVAMTPGASAFVRPLSFAAVTGNPVLTSLFPDASGAADKALYPHLYPASEIDCFILAPATANTIAKIACGLGEDIVSASCLALKSSCARFFCPAMNTHMWNQPVVQSNVERLEQLGWKRIGPASGTLACGVEGEGRMSEPEDIVKQVHEHLKRM